MILNKQENFNRSYESIDKSQSDAFTTSELFYFYLQTGNMFFSVYST
jgi:hypothetical protein